MRTPPVWVARVVNGVRAGALWAVRRVVPAQVAVLEALDGAWFTQMLYAAAELDIAGALSEGPRTPEQVARTAGADADAIHRLLRSLAAHGVFARTGDGRYRNNRLSNTLRAGVANSTRDMVRFVGHPVLREQWSGIADVIRSGVDATRTLRGMPSFEHMDADPELAGVFHAAMASLSAVEIPSILAAYDFARFPVIADLGGGQGKLLAAVLQQTPTTHGILFDLPVATQGAPNYLATAGVSNRVTVVHGSFLSPADLPEADAYLLKHILHDWTDEESTKILSAIAEKAPPHATLLLIEMVVPPTPRRHPSFSLDIEMLVQTGGRERTAAEFRKLLWTSGFHLKRIVPTAGPTSLLEAHPR
ncbi:methyltransferase [Nocardia terpenica]|uniref:methyltransferase n=1 Tax=Nocardia terpenica TaxID=455432 RepID=UPI0018E0A60F|nr:methyltransferase [Nocardia terpenica]